MKLNPSNSFKILTEKQTNSPFQLRNFSNGKANGDSVAKQIPKGGSWQNIPEVVRKAISSLLDNQNQLTDKIEQLEQRIARRVNEAQESTVERQEKITRVVSKLGDQVQGLEHSLKGASLDLSEQYNLKLRKFVLCSELDSKLKDIHERIDKGNKTLKGRITSEEFQRAIERVDTQAQQVKRRLQEKADELDLEGLKDDLERLVSAQMQKMGKLVAENSVKILRNKKEITKKVAEKAFHQLLSSKLEVVRVTSRIWRASSRLCHRRRTTPS